MKYMNKKFIKKVIYNKDSKFHNNTQQIIFVNIDLFYHKISLEQLVISLLLIGRNDK